MNWYYAVGGTQKGPVSEEEFRGLVANGIIQDSTLVWSEGMPDWQQYGALRGGAGPGAAHAAATADGGASIGGGGAAAATLAAPGDAIPGPTRLVFTGNASEYFKIWIVNLLLTVVTLGIYAAWAKVRTRRYFYANTRLFGHTFEYLADPVKILIGNIIVIALFVALNFASALSLVAYVVLAVLLLFATPWFVIRALTFNARYSAWRGLRFQFQGRYGEAFVIFVLLPLLVAVSFGLAYPWVAKKRREWVVSRHAFGATRFNFHGETAEFYKIYLVAFALFLPLVIAYLSLFAIGLTAQRGGAEPPVWIAVVFPLMMVGFPLAYCGFFYLRVRLFNYSWQNTTIGAHRFEGTMRFWDYFGIQFTNSLLTSLTFGLMYPWAKVRLASYMASSLVVIPGSNLEEFVASAQAEVSAIGEAAGDIFDLDVGIDFGL